MRRLGQSYASPHDLKQLPAALLRTAPPRLGVASEPLAAGDDGIAQTVEVMTRLAQGAEGAQNPYVRMLALDITRGLGARDYYGQIEAIYDWVKQNIEFRGEFSETVQSPLVTLQMGAGDCDCQATLVAALLGAQGIATRPVTVAADAEDPETFTHVYLEAFDRGANQWVPLDTTVPSASPGWAPERVYRRREWPAMSGLAGLGDAQSDGALLIQDVAAPLAQGAAAALANRSNSASFGLNFGSTSNF
ncbi:MAG TPA: transglutaminase-like domain-containing protein, partial [Terriglobales bacterium]|nr:transglutaminase-like domain-containing protein [Terriglobales bacterium]